MLTKSQIENIVEKIKKEKRVDAILLTGSYVYGHPTEASDLDIRMVTNDGSQKAHWNDLYKFGVRIEAFYNTPTFIRTLFDKSHEQLLPPHVIHFWAHGKLVYDKTGIGKALQEEAKKLWQQGPSKEGAWRER